MPTQASADSVRSGAMEGAAGTEHSSGPGNSSFRRELPRGMVSSKVDLAHQPQTLALSIACCYASEGSPLPPMWGPKPSRPGGHVHGLRRGRDIQDQEFLLHQEVGRGGGWKWRKVVPGHLKSTMPPTHYKPRAQEFAQDSNPCSAI